MDTKKIAEGMAKAVMEDIDALAAKLGEDHLMVKIRRNSAKIESCLGHRFLPDPLWRQDALMSRRKVECAHCHGEMAVSDAMRYLQGWCHGTGEDYAILCNTIWPPVPAQGEGR